MQVALVKILRGLDIKSCPRNTASPVRPISLRNIFSACESAQKLHFIIKRELGTSERAGYK